MGSETPSKMDPTLRTPAREVRPAPAGMTVLPVCRWGRAGAGPTARGCWHHCRRDRAPLQVTRDGNYAYFRVPAYLHSSTIDRETHERDRRPSYHRWLPLGLVLLNLRGGPTRGPVYGVDFAYIPKDSRIRIGRGSGVFG